jgi:EAL domain-containing protein (putative c-di-GMP-specific phosphodiesterase class I)
MTLLDMEITSDATPTVLLLDDEASVIDGLRRALRKEPFRIVATTSVSQAMAALDESDIDVVVADDAMPEMKGCDFLALARDRHPQTVRVMLTGHSDVSTAMAAVNEAGVFRFHTKPCDAQQLAQSLHAAIAARSKAIGRDASSAAHDASRAKEFVAELTRARVVFQPIVRAATRKVYAYEALIRPAQLSAMSAGVLIENAIVTGMTRELDRFVRTRVAESMEMVPDAAGVFVNVFPSSLTDPDMLSDGNPLAPFRERVVWEITEWAQARSMDGVEEALRYLRRTGYRIAIDDLGSGYSDLTSLASMAPDVTKIDMGLVRDIDTSPTRRAVVAAVVSACAHIGSKCVAEGIETEAEADTLAALGCELLQGYYFGSPAPLPARTPDRERSE